MAGGAAKGVTGYEQRIYLFDVDGVLVNPVAYRLGITKTLIELCKKIGLQNIDRILPEEAEIAAMEAQGVHDVWDITNIVFCDILTTIALQFDPIETLPNTSHESSAEYLHALKTLNPSVARPDYLQMAQDLASTAEHNHPPDIALQLFSNRLLALNQYKIWMEFLKRFLVGTRSAYTSYGTRLFQNIILGSEDFERTYQLDSEYEGMGLLRAEDKTLINRQTVDSLTKLNANANYAIGVYTARPSLPPKLANLSPVGYSPEAEIALENAGMSAFPLIGMGMMEWLGKQHDERTEDLTKPNPTQALAALINTITNGQDVLALTEAYAIDKQEKNPTHTPLNAIEGRKTIIYVFEDTISGIVPLQKTTSMLQSKGFKIELEPLGIATDANKKASLEKHCKRVFKDVNEAFDSIALSPTA